MLLIHLISAVTWGGGETYALDVCRHFREKGWKVLALTRASNAVDSHFEKASIKVRHLGLRGYTDFLSPLRLARILRRHRQESTVIHVHKYKDAFTALLARKLSRRADVKVVMTRHLVKPPSLSRLALRIYRNLDALVFVSALVRDSFLSAWGKGGYPYSRQRLHLLHNSRNVHLLPFQPLPEKGPRIILYLGRLHPDKGLETLIEALPALRGHRARCQIVGTGNADYIDSLRRLATRLGVMDLIDWKGFVDSPEQLLRECHIAVLPSRWAEPFGLANIEVMAAGRVQIATSNGAQKEYLIPGRDSFLIEPGDSEALANYLLTLLDTPGLAEKMGHAALQAYSDNLSWPRFAEKLERIYLLPRHS